MRSEINANDTFIYLFRNLKTIINCVKINKNYDNR